METNKKIDGRGLLELANARFGVQADSIHTTPYWMYLTYYLCGFKKLASTTYDRYHICSIPAHKAVNTDGIEENMWVPKALIDSEAIDHAIQSCATNLTFLQEVYLLEVSYVMNGNYSTINERAIYTNRKDAELAILDIRERATKVNAEIKTLKYDPDKTTLTIEEVYSELSKA